MSAAWTSAGRITAAGKSIEYACLGPSTDEAPTLILLHEGLGCVRLWRDFPKALVAATGLGVFAFSRAAYGQSDPVELPRPLDYMTREARDVLPEVLDAVGAQHVVLLGHSDGATIAAIHAGIEADPRVLGIILMAPHFFTEPQGLSAIAQARVAYEKGDLKEALARYHANPDNAFLGWNDAWLDPAFETWNVESVIDTIRVPVLAIQGCDDQYGTLAQIHTLSRRTQVTVDTLILDACRHNPHLDCEGDVVSAVAGFCARVLPNEP